MHRWVRRIGLALGAVAGLAALAAVAIYVRSEQVLRQRHPVPAIEVVVPRDAESIAEGQRLATVRGCMEGCHGKQGEGVMFFDEPAIARLVAPSLAAAARRYSDSQLIAIIRDGVRPDGRSVFVMPAQTFAYLTDSDVARIVAFIRTLPAADGPGPGISIGPLGRVGLATGKFKTAAQLIAETAPLPDGKTELGNRGRYLARTICTECHGLALQGDSNPEFSSPDLRVVAAYSAEDFTRLMRTGIAVGGRKLGMMRIRAERNLSHLTDDEIAALYDYLHALATT